MEEIEFNQIYEEMKDVVYRIAFTYVRNSADALDIVQDVMIRLYRYDGVFNDDLHRRQWIIRVTVNKAKDVLKVSWFHHKEIDFTQIPDLRNKDKNILEEILQIPLKYRSVIVLHYYEGYTYAEIAKMLRIGESAAKMRAERGRKLLKLELTEGD